MLVAEKQINERYRERYWEENRKIGYDTEKKHRPNPTPKQKPRVLGKLLLISQVLLVIGAIVYLLCGYAAITKIRIDLTAIEKEINALEKEKQNLNVQLASVDDVSKIEHRAMTELGMQKPQENNMARVAVNVQKRSLQVENIDVHNDEKGFRRIVTEVYNRLTNIFH